MDNYVVHATGTFVLASQEPSSADIIDVLNRTFPAGVSTWVGPSPRITRTGTDASIPLTIFGAGNPRVDVAWVFSLPEGEPGVAATVATAMQQAFNDNLNGRWTAQVSPFDPSVNGSIDWWTSGQNAASPTREQPAVGSSEENPVGPTSDSTTTQNLLDRINPFASRGPGQTSVVDALTKLLTVVGVVAAGGTLLYLTWPMLSGARAVASSRSKARARFARANPSRRRRRTRK